MKKWSITLISLFALIACKNGNNQNSTTLQEHKEDTQKIGGAKDEHGCLKGAGESWSKLNQTCLRLFESGLRLDPVEMKENEAVISAFILYNTDKTKVEVFLPDDTASIILDQTAEKHYQNDRYTFDAKENTLYIKGEKKYTQMI